MTLKEYQRVANLYDENDDEAAQIGWVFMDMFNMSHDQVMALNKKQFIKYSKIVAKRFHNIDKKPFWSPFKFEIDAFKITLGQFIECQHFMKQGQIDSLHLVGASIWKDKRTHQIKSEILSNTNVRHVLQDITQFFLSFAKLVDSYKGLFETDETESESDELAKPDKPHPFADQYGWIYSAKQVAEHEGITLDAAFDLPVVQAFNALAYLKAFQSFQKHLNK